MATDFETTEREDRLASVSESGVSLVTKERLAELKAQLDEDRHLLEQERAIQARTRSGFDKERAELDEKAETLAIEAERLRERTRDIEQRETAVRQREAALVRKQEQDDATNPRVDNAPVQDWNLPTVAASIEEAQAMLKNGPQRKAPATQPRATGKQNGGSLNQIMLANPVATFAFGFAAAMLAMMLLWAAL